MELWKQAAEKNIHVFLEGYRITNDQGEQLDFKDHPYLWDIYEDFSPKQAIRKAAQIGFCLSPETKILTADLRWVSLDEIKIGESIVGVDEEHNGRLQGRKTRVAKIEDKKEIIEESYELLLENGIRLIATPNHRFLSKFRGSVHTVWREVNNFRVGDQIRYFCDVWGESSLEDAWMGGILDGEGSMRRHGSSNMCIVQTKGNVLDRIHKYFVDRNYIHRFADRTKTKKGVGSKPIWEVSTSNTAEILKIVGLSRPTRFIERTDWWENKCLGRDKNKKSWYKVTKITPSGKRRMIDVRTSTKTFIAEGFVSHNSTTANIKAFWLAKHKGMDIIYSLPSSSDIKDFVSGKTNRLIAQNPIFQEWTTDKDSIEQKKVGNNIIYFRGTWTERAAIAIPADLYISDETDRSKQDIVIQYQTRLQHSKYAWEWYFSNPSVPGMGVDRFFEQSDQKHWFVKCGCGKWQFMTLEHIQGTPPMFVCSKCGKELERRNGEWVRRWQNKEYSGYWIPSFVNPKITAQQILDKKKQYTEEQFANFVQGIPYVGKGNILSRQAFFQNLTNVVNSQRSRPIIGVDTGVDIKYVVGNDEGIFFYDKANDYEPIRSLLQRWPNAIAIIDQGGDIIGPRKLREEFKNRVFLCFFRRDRKNDQIIQWNEDDGTVIADRNKIIQLVVDEFTEKRIPINGTEADWQDFWLEWAGMYRTVEESDVGPERYEWHKPSTGRCDFPFASVYWRIGMDKYSHDYAQFIDPKNTSFAFRGTDEKPRGIQFLPKYKSPPSFPS